MTKFIYSVGPRLGNKEVRKKMLLTGPKEHLNDVSSVRDFGRMGRRLSVSKISFKLKTTSE